MIGAHFHIGHTNIHSDKRTKETVDRFTNKICIFFFQAIDLLQSRVGCCGSFQPRDWENTHWGEGHQVSYLGDWGRDERYFTSGWLGRSILGIYNEGLGGGIKYILGDWERDTRYILGDWKRDISYLHDTGRGTSVIYLWTVRGTSGIYVGTGRGT